ncbi:MAG: PQQ-binding-like beta-propeller repeat protein [Chloroflexota bacterium]|nr:PQQ-binding-like beta-propeller repeat protein [Chloroflexota bacterium]
MNLTTGRRIRLSIIMLLLALATTSCVGTRMGVSWPSVGLVELNGQEHISLSYNDQVAILSPANGVPARLINPESGNPIRDSENNPRSWVLSGAAYENAQFYALPIRLDAETLLAADHNKRLLKVDSVVAEVQRAIPVADQVVANILEVGDVIYVPYQNGGLRATSKIDFSELWTFPTSGGIWARPLLVDDMIVVPSMNHQLYAIDRASGVQLWSADLGGSVASTPLLANGRLYVGSFNKSFFEISLDGRILSKYDTQNWVWGTPAIDEIGIIYVADLSGYVHALDTRNALAERWSVQVAERGIQAGPLFYDQRVIVSSRDGKVYWLDSRDGELINAREIEGAPELLGNLLLLEPSETLNIDEPLIIVSSVDPGKLLIAFGVDGRQTWVYPR